MKNFKKLISVILALMMIMSVIPVGATGNAAGGGAGAGAGGGSSQTPAIPAENIIFEEDFEDYTGGEDLLTITDDVWEFRQTASTTLEATDAATIVNVSEIQDLETTGFSGKALKLHNDAATAYNAKNLMYRLNLANAIDLDTAQYADKKLFVELDVIFAPVSGNYGGGDFQSSFFVPSNVDSASWLNPSTVTFNTMYGASWKWLYRKNTIAVQTGDYADPKKTGAAAMRYNHGFAEDTAKDTATKVKFAYDFNGGTQTASVWVNGKKLTDELDNKPIFTGHALNDTVIDEFYVTNKHGQQNDFGAITGFWGSVSDVDMYMDNIKIYAMDQLQLESVTGNTSAFNPVSDALEFNFSSAIDAVSITNCAELLTAGGTVVENGITNVSLKDKDTIAVQITDAVSGQTDYKIRIKGVKDVYGNTLQSEYTWYTYPINDYYTLNGGAGTYSYKGADYSFTYAEGNGTSSSPAKITANNNTAPIDCYVKAEGSVEGTFTTCTVLALDGATPATVTDYIQGTAQEVVLTFNDELALTDAELLEAFEVTDANGDAVTGLAPVFGAAKDEVKLQLSTLILGRGNHIIKSKANALYNAAGTYADVEYTFGTLDFNAVATETAVDYIPTTDKEITVNLTIPTTLTNANIATGFVVKDALGGVVNGLAATLDGTGKVVTLKLNGLEVTSGTYTIDVTDALVDGTGRTAMLDAVIEVSILEFTSEVSENNGFFFKPGDSKEVEIELSIPTVLTNANIASAFSVVDESGRTVNGLAVSLDGTSKIITLTLNNLVVDEGVYYIKSNDTLKDQAGRTLPEINLMFNVAKKTMLFSEDFEEGYTLNENWINDGNKVSSGNYSVGNGAWDIQSNNSTDSVSVVDVTGLNLGGNFSGKALRLYNDAATSYSSGYFAFRRNFNGGTGISLTSGEYAGKKLVYEADIVFKNVAGAYTSDHLSSVMLVSKNKNTIRDYADKQWKLAFMHDGRMRVEEGSWADESRGARLMWYNTPTAAHNYSTEAGKLKVILDQTGIVDSITVEANGQVVTSTAPEVLNGHKRNGFETSALMPSGYQGQEFNFADTIYGIWGAPSDMEIYMDNFQAYLIDSFSVESVEVDGNASAFEASTDSVVYTFTGEVDPGSIRNAVDVYDANGEKVGTAVKSVALEGGNKVLRVTLAKSIAGESTYKVVLNDNIKDIYGAGISMDYQWYEYPINDYYTAVENNKYSVNSVLCTYVPKSGSTPAMMTVDGNYETYVDCYVQVSSTANREVEFTTSRKIVVENVSPAVITGYDLGKDQVVTITLAEEISASTNLNNAFTVTDEDGKNITGLQASFGDTTNVIKLQLKDLALGNGKHFIESVDGALANAEGIFANVSIAVSTVDFMVTYAEPGSEVLAEYKQGDNQVVVFGLSSPAAVTSTDVSSAFDVYDADGNVVTGIQATYNANDVSKTNDDTISIQLSGLSLGKGKHTIKVNSNLLDRRGRTLTYEYIFTKLPFKATYESAISDYEPKTDKEIVINLTYELSDATIANLNNAFVVENAEGLTVSGLAASASDDKLAIKLQLKDLDISGGQYKITSKSGAIVCVTGEELATVSITVDTGSDAAFGPSEGEGAGSGAPLAPGTDFSTVVLLDENFENTTEKAEKGIEFVPQVNWYTSPEKIPSGFGVVKTGTEYRDAEVKIMPDPADPAGGNMVLMYSTGAYGKDGSLIGTPHTTSSGINYTTLTRDLDNTTATITRDQYTEVHMSSKIYVKSTSLASLPLSGQQLRNSQYIFAAKSATNTPLTSTNFAKDSNTGNPKFHTYQSSKASTSNGKTGGFDGVFTTNEWHTMEYVFSVHEFVEDGGAMKGAFHVYIDGKLVSDSAFLANDYNTLTGMIVKLVPTDAGGSITVYYDDWKITQSTKYRTHVDTPSTNVPENQDITLTLTKPLDSESVNLINESLTNNNVEDMVVVKDAEGNVVDATITVAPSGDVITIDPTNGLKYNTEYLVEVKPSVKVNGMTQLLKSTDGEEYAGISYPFATAKAKDTYIDAEASAASFAASTANGATQDMGEATRFAYTMNLSGAHGTDVIAAVAAFTEKEELIGIQYQTITAGATAANFDFNTFAGKTGAKTVRMYIWERISDGNGGFKMGRLMQLPDEITSR